MTEREKNSLAEKILGHMINTCQWINVHTLYQGSENLILELRDSNGFGARWEVDQQFRGLIEP